MKTIKLGQPMAEMPQNKPTQAEPMYPTINIEHPQANKIPDKGTANIKYHVSHRTTSLHKGKKKHSATVNVHSFSPSGGFRTPTDEESIEALLPNESSNPDEAAEGEAPGQ